MPNSFWPWWFAALPLALWVLPRLLDPGMFFDGTLYATLARNLVAGRGSWWSPAWSAAVPAFHEHPPLGIWLQWPFFLILGDHWWVEKLYCALQFAIGAALLAALWRRLAPSPARADAWLPLLLWVVGAGELVPWAHMNNLLEAPLANLAMGAVLLQLRALDAPGIRRRRAAAVGAAACLGAGFLVKGPVALFPLVAPMLLTWSGPDRQRRRRAIACVMVQAVALAALGAALVAWPEPRQALVAWVDQQLAPSIDGRRADGSLAGALSALPGALRWMGVLALVVFGAQLARSGGGMRALRAALRTPVDACLGPLGIALSASVPLAIASRFHGHYLVPSVPWFALATGIALATVRQRPRPVAVAATRTSAPRRRAIAVEARGLASIAAGARGLASIALLSASLAACAWVVTHPGHKAQRLARIGELASHLPTGAVVAMLPVDEASVDWELVVGAARVADLAIDWRPAAAADAHWLLASAAPMAVPSGRRWCPTGERFERLVLYRSCDPSFRADVTGHATRGHGR